MSVEQLKDGRWLCRYPKGKDSDRPTTSKKYFGRGPEAEQAALEYNASMGLGIRKTRQSPTFTELANEYLTAKKHSLTNLGFEKICNRVGNTIIPFFGDVQAHNINYHLLDKFVAKRRKKVKSTTVYNDLSSVRTILRWSARRRLIASNPMSGYEMPKKDDARLQPPTMAEINAIVECASPHIQRAVLLSYYTGLRPGRSELFCLKWDNVDFVNRTLMVVSAAKGGLPVRMVPLGKTILNHLESWHEKDSKDNIRFIVNYRGRQVESIKTGWNAAKKRAKITRRLRLYDLRHAAITTLLERGADLKSVSEIAGHASPDITMKVYQHVSSKLKRAAIDLLD